MYKQVQKGFTLIELMIVIAIVGILAAIALPAYQDYIVRSKMSEPAAALAEAKTSVAEFYATNNRVPVSGTEAGILLNPDKPIVASVWYASDARLPFVLAVLQDNIIPGDTGGNEYGFGLSGTTGGSNTLVWVCKGQGFGALTWPGNPTEIASKYLPSNCRN